MSEKGQGADGMALREWLSLRFQFLWVYRKKLGEEMSGAASFDFQSALYVVDGWVEVEGAESAGARAGRGEWLVTRQGRRRQRIGPGTEVLSVGFRFQRATGEAVYDGGLPLVFAGADFPAVKGAAERLHRRAGTEMETEYLPMDAPLTMTGFLTVQNEFRNFLVTLGETLERSGVVREVPVTPDRRVQHALRIIGERRIGKPLRVAGLARQVGLSTAQLDRLMIKATGKTAFEQIEQHRLQAIRDELSGGESPLKRLAYEHGFSSPSHLTHWFRRKQGTTPKAYRDRRK